MTYEELVAMGIDPEEAKLIAKNTGGEQTSSGLPFDVVKINYDKDDVLINEGVKKGEIITGWEIDKKTLEVKKRGKVFKQPVKMRVIAIGYQYSAYDISKNGYSHITPVFTNIMEGKDIVEVKTGETVGALKDKGVKLTFNQILLVTIDEDGKENPYLIYLRGVNYMKFWEQVRELIGDDHLPLKYYIYVKTRKEVTNGRAVWVYDIEKIEPLKPKELQAKIKETIPLIKKWDEWVESTGIKTKVPTKASEIEKEVAEQEDDDDLETSY